MSALRMAADAALLCRRWRWAAPAAVAVMLGACAQKPPAGPQVFSWLVEPGASTPWQSARPASATSELSWQAEARAATSSMGPQRGDVPAGTAEPPAVGQKPRIEDGYPVALSPEEAGIAVERAPERGYRFSGGGVAGLRCQRDASGWHCWR